MDSEVSKPVDSRSVIGNLHSYAPPSRRSSFDSSRISLIQFLNLKMVKFVYSSMLRSRAELEFDIPTSDTILLFVFIYFWKWNLLFSVLN